MLHTAGAVLSPTDTRDWQLLDFLERGMGGRQEAKVAMSIALPARHTFRSVMQPIFRQGLLGACVGGAVIGAMGYQQNVYPSPDGKGIDAQVLSVMDVYTGARKTLPPPSEQGAYIRGAVQYVYYVGACLESEMPYNEEGIPRVVGGTPDETRKANRIGYYAWLDPKDIYAIKQGLYYNGPAVISSIITQGLDELDSKFRAERRGYERGLHAMVIVGWDDELQCWIVRNTWGEEFGDKGYFYLPYSYGLEEVVVTRPAKDMVIPQRGFLQRQFPNRF